MERPGAYIPSDRLEVLAAGATLPDRTNGAALFADISGFTPLTEALTRELGPQRGAEELTRHLNLVYDALVDELNGYGGSVIGFSGDAITCWFDGDRGVNAAAGALAMQRAMQRFTSIALPSGQALSLAMKATVAAGPARRFVVGDPNIQVMDVLAGALLDRLAAAEHHAGKGEVVVDSATLAALGDTVNIVAWREDEESGQRFGVIDGLTIDVRRLRWSPPPPDALSEEQIRPWLLPAVYERLKSGQGEFLAELRPAVALFLHFSGIDYDGNDAAGDQLDTFVRKVQHILSQYDASLLQLTIGDKGSFLYAAFGAPLAHEDDAVRAASAALELRALQPELDFIRNVQIGISQGRMRTGAYGGTERRTYGVLGDEVNLACRLMQAAAPGQILASKVAQTTRDAFVWESPPAIRVKGKSEPITIFSLVGPKEHRAIRLQGAAYALPMVGRQAELALIGQKLSQALNGRGQIIGITAEAGMGKSRLVAETIRLANERKLAGYYGECQSYGTNTSYLVWQSIWWNLFGLDPARSMDEQVQALEAQLARIAPALALRLPLLGAVLNLPIPDNDLTRPFDAKLRKTSLEALLVDYLRARAAETPMLIVLEDCQWLDPLSHDLLEVIGRTIAGLPVLLIMAYRLPELHRAQAPRVSQLPHFTEVRLSDFTPQEAERLIGLKLEQFFGSQIDIPRASVERITARAQGNPFYIEELLNYLQDRGVDPHDSQALEQLDLPNSLHSLILTRIDQLSESQKTTLRVASVIGRLFKAAVLWGAYPPLGDAHKVKTDLDMLNRLELTQVDSEPELSYLFKHIVTQEVAYESLPFATRAMLHDQIGQYIERTYAATLDQYIDLLAHHFDRSQNDAKKREYLLKAGEAAQANYANTAAIDYYRRVLSLLPVSEQVGVMRRLGQVLELVGQWNEAGDMYRRALELADQSGDRQGHALCQVAMGELLRKQGRYADATAWFDRARAAFEAIGDEAGVAQVLHYAGTVAAQQGERDRARQLYESSLAIRRKLNDKPRIGSLLSNLGIIARNRGDLAAARALFEEGLAIRREVGDRGAIANSLNNLGNIALDQGDRVEARARLEEALALLREIGDRYNLANALDNLGNVVRAQGDYPTARALYRQSLITTRDLGDRWTVAYLLEDIGGLAALEGEAERALRLVGAAAALREAIGAPLSPTEQAKLDRMLETARSTISESAQAATLAKGRAMSLDQAIDYALDGRSAPS